MSGEMDMQMQMMIYDARRRQLPTRKGATDKATAKSTLRGPRSRAPTRRTKPSRRSSTSFMLPTSLTNSSKKLRTLRLHWV